MNIALGKREEKIKRVHLQFTRIVVVCMTAGWAAKEVVPGYGAMGAVSGLFQHLLQHLASADQG